MGRLQMHFAWYMASYTVLMFASWALWAVAGCFEAGSFVYGLQAASSFLLDFAVIAYPLYVAIRFIIGRMTGRMGMRPDAAGRDGRHRLAARLRSSISA